MKKPISATIDEELISWIESEVDGQKFRNRSHLIEVALQGMRKGGKR
jgi:Arc/MetJ-type ribon-helix-helix transcriptional regulator